MKVLWVVNFPFPEVLASLGIHEQTGGGWVHSLAREIGNGHEIRLGVATIGNSFERIESKDLGITYYVLKSSRSRKISNGLIKQWRSVYDDFLPDIIHIHGTEYSHGLAMMMSHPKERYVVSIQGMVGIYARYFLGGLSHSEIYRNLTIRDLLKRDSIIQGKRRFEKRGSIEREYINRAAIVLGRTSWDYAHVININPTARYRECNEVLRSTFYLNNKWAPERAERHAIFCSQGGVPHKGLHKLLCAVGILKKEYPDISLRIAGVDATTRNGPFKNISVPGYGKILRSIIRRYELEKHVVFTGSINESEMTKEFLRARVFVSPSCIENSPNSIGEAQILGVPVVASFVGGVPDMVISGETGLLYRYEEVEMLVQCLRRVFRDEALARHLSEKSISAAEQRHDRNLVKHQLLGIYTELLEIEK